MPRKPRPCWSDSVSAGPSARCRLFWKHRDTLGRTKYGTLGWIALPNVFLFQLLLPLFSPLIDFVSLGRWRCGDSRNSTSRICLSSIPERTCSVPWSSSSDSC